MYLNGVTSLGIRCFNSRTTTLDVFKSMMADVEIPEVTGRTTTLDVFKFGIETMSTAINQVELQHWMYLNKKIDKQ